jgi:hypothetical protein
MLLRASGQAEGTDIDLDPVMDGREGVGTGVPNAAALLQFSEAAVTGSTDDLDAARNRVIEELGHAEMIDAAAVIGNFQKNVRIADSTGIPLDDFLEERSADFRDRIGIETFR